MTTIICCADDLIKLPADQLNFQVSQSKQCLLDHGINNPSTFAVPQGNAVDNSTVIESIARYYDYAINGFSPSMRLDCNNDLTGCAIYSDNVQLTNLNRYSVREWSHNTNDKKYDYNSTAIFNNFVDVVDSQFKYNDNKNGIINAIPLISYHSIDNDRTSSSTEIDLFATEMKYLYDNGFKVLSMHIIGYDQINNHLYMKVPGATESGTPNPNSQSICPAF